MRWHYSLIAAAVLLSTILLGSSSHAASNVASSYFDLGDLHWSVSTRQPEAATWFDRGVVLCYGFNHEEAIRCFERALASDPELAMAYWGIAYALGPNYNNPVMGDEAAERAAEVLQKAARLARTASPLERALIAALANRYSLPNPEERASLDLAYADAMRTVYAAHPDDPNVATLFAESLMMLRPWKLWSPEGEPAPETPEIRTVLEKGLAQWPDHPGLCHLYIHTMEPSPDPGAAQAAADRLRNSVPDSGHLVHMPSHIDVLLGHYDKVIAANQKAIAVDRKYVEREGRLNFYTLYRLHNFHFLVYGAMFDGQYKLAMNAAQELVSEIPPELLAEWPDYLEAFVPTPLHVQVRFGHWQEIIDELAPPEDQPFTRAIWHYARTVAYAALGKVAEAQGEYAVLLVSADEVPESRLLFNNTCREILKIAIAMAGGEVQYRMGNYEQAFALLREAIAIDDGLNYDEPWGWMQPVRHALGALLLEQGRVEEAEQIYREDLAHHPNNGWSLKGLAEALQRRGASEEAAACEARFASAWKRSDVSPSASCYCRTGKIVAR